MPKLCVLPGDGIGGEVVPVAVGLLQALIKDLEVCWAQAGWDCFQKTGRSVSDDALEKLANCGAGLFGAVASPSRPVEGYQSAILTLRRHFQLYANIRPTWRLPVVSPDRQVDLVLFRENSEGLYLSKEIRKGDEVIAQRRISVAASRRLAKTALEFMAQSKKTRMTIVHKANVLPLSDGLFRDTVMAEVERARNHGQTIEVEELLVDAAGLKLVSQPERFQIIVAPNLYGDILSDVAAYWMGGLGLAPSLNWGATVALAEPVHGAAPDIAGSGLAHPGATILSASMLLRWVWSRPQLADCLENALNRALEIWGPAPMKTHEFGQLVAAQLVPIAAAL